MKQVCITFTEVKDNMEVGFNYKDENGNFCDITKNDIESRSCLAFGKEFRKLVQIWADSHSDLKISEQVLQ